MLGMKKFVIALLSIFVISVFVMTYYQRTITFSPNDVHDAVDEESKRRYDRLIEWKEVLNDRGSGVRERRLPDAIGIGVKKCGTGAMSHFLGQHPLIKLPKRVETFFFNKFYAKGIWRYIAIMPKATKGELVMEKTPSYFYSAKAIKRIQQDVPNVKLILLLCDPVKRAFSDFVHNRYPSHQNAEPSYFANAFQDLADTFTSRFTDEQKDLTLLADEAKRKCVAKKGNCVISHGMYHFEVRNWMDSFNDSQLLVLNGDLWLTDPGRLIEEIQEFLEIPKLITRDDFVKSPGKGFYCLNRWWTESLGDTLHIKGNEEADDNGLFCLGKGKGRTRSGLRTMHPGTYKKLKGFYKPHNELLYLMLNKSMGW